MPLSKSPNYQTYPTTKLRIYPIHLSLVSDPTRTYPSDLPVLPLRQTVAFPLTRMPGYGMFEYACHEGNYGLRNALSGSRAVELGVP